MPHDVEKLRSARRGKRHFGRAHCSPVELLFARPDCGNRLARAVVEYKTARVGKELQFEEKIRLSQKIAERVRHNVVRVGRKRRVHLRHPVVGGVHRFYVRVLQAHKPSPRAQGGRKPFAVPDVVGVRKHAAQGFCPPLQIGYKRHVVAVYGQPVHALRRVDVDVFVAVFFEDGKEAFVVFVKGGARIFWRTAVDVRSRAVVFYPAFAGFFEESVEERYSVVAGEGGRNACGEPRRLRRNSLRRQNRACAFP